MRLGFGYDDLNEDYDLLWDAHINLKEDVQNLLLEFDRVDMGVAVPDEVDKAIQQVEKALSYGP